MNGCSKMDHTFAVFNNNVSRIFIVTQCENAAIEYTLKCNANYLSTRYSKESGTARVSASICKQICIIDCSFKYAALYE